MQKKILVFISSLLISLFCGEVGLRILFGKLSSYENMPLHDLKLRFTEKTTEFDPILSWKPKADFRKIETTLLPNNCGKKRFRTALTTLENGMRITPNSWNVTLNQEKRILTLGDSFTYGGEVNDEETWPAHLQAILKIPVFNAAFNGYGLDQSFLSLEPLLKKTHPQLVILSIIRENIFRTVKTVRIKSFTGQPVSKPYFRVVDEKLELMNTPLQDTGHWETPQSLKSFLGRSVLADFIFSQIAFNFWYGVKWAEDFPQEYFSNQKPEEVSCLILREFKKLGRAYHFIPVVLGQYYWRDTTQKSERDSLTQKVLECSRNLKINTIDLWDGFEELRVGRSEEYNTLFFPGHHMTNRGNLWVAKNLAKQLESLISN